MPASFRQRFLGIMVDDEQAMKALFSDLATQLIGMVGRSADYNGAVRNGEMLRRDMVTVITSLFLSRTMRGDLAPFETVNGQPVPLSPFMRVLWSMIQRTQQLAQEQQQRFIDRALTNAPDVALALRMKRLSSPGLPVARVGEMDWTGYDAPHTWVDPNGYRLSDRIWRLTNDARRRIDLYMEDALRQGKSAVQISKELEAFLVPGRSLYRTNKPYGTDLSADAMRLARTEITAAHTQAQAASAQENPFVETYDVVLSSQHDRPDECDDAAQAGPYEKGKGPLPPFHSHCMCYVRWNITQSPGDVIGNLRSQLEIA